MVADGSIYSVVGGEPADVVRKVAGPIPVLCEYACECRPGYLGAASYGGMSVYAFAEEGLQLSIFADACVGKTTIGCRQRFTSSMDRSSKSRMRRQVASIRSLAWESIIRRMA